MNDEDLRDFFAGMSLVGILGGLGTLGFRPDSAAALAYETADAMIKAKYAVKELPEEGIASVVKKSRKSKDV